MSQQVPSQAYSAAPQNAWENSLLGCMSDCRTCWVGWCCPCILFGESYEKMGMGSYSTGCWYWCLGNCIVGSILRGQIAKAYNLETSCCGACMAYTCCGSCALCQDAREINHRQKADQFVMAAATSAPQPQMMTSK